MRLLIVFLVILTVGCTPTKRTKHGNSWVVHSEVRCHDGSWALQIESHQWFTYHYAVWVPHITKEVIVLQEAKCPAER